MNYARPTPVSLLQTNNSSISLLTKVKSQSSAKESNRSEASDEMVEVAIAYAKHEVTANQIKKALGLKPGQVAQKIRHALFSAIRTGRLVLKK